MVATSLGGGGLRINPDTHVQCPVDSDHVACASAGEGNAFESRHHHHVKSQLNACCGSAGGRADPTSRGGRGPGKPAAVQHQAPGIGSPDLASHQLALGKSLNCASVSLGYHED